MGELPRKYVDDRVADRFQARRVLETLLHKCGACRFFDRGECNSVQLPVCFQIAVGVFESERRTTVSVTEPTKRGITLPWTAGPDDKPLVRDLDTKEKVHEMLFHERDLDTKEKVHEMLFHELMQNMKRIPPGIRVGIEVHWTTDKPIPESDELVRRVRAKLKERGDGKAEESKAD